MKHYFIIIFIFLFSLPLFSQSIQQEFVKVYNHSPGSNEYVNDMKMDDDGNVYICGYTENSSGYQDFLLLKYNNSGNLIWSRTFDSTAYDIANEIRLDNNGNIYLLGTIDLILYYALLKYDSSGHLIWKTIYNHPEQNERIGGFTLDNSGNVYMCGTTNFINGDMLTIKFDSSGNLIWQKIFTGRIEGHEGGNDVKINNNFIYILGGSVTDTSGGQINRDITIVQYDTSGSLLDTIFYDGGVLRESGSILLFDKKNNFIVSGTQDYGIPYAHDIFLTELDSTGIKHWFTIYRNNVANNESELLKNILFDSYYNIFLLCRSTYQPPQPAAPRSAYTIIKYNTNGDSLWTRKYVAVNYSTNYPEDFALDSSGNAYITGYSNFNQLNDRVATVKYSSAGEKIWDVNYFNPFTDNVGKKILLDKDGGIFVSGESNAFGNGWDIVLIKYNETTAIIGNPPYQPGNFSLSQNYPNPFNSETIIKYEIPKKGNYQLELIDILGRKVDIIFNKITEPGAFEVIYNADNLSSGVYFYRLINNDNILTKRFLLIK